MQPGEELKAHREAMHGEVVVMLVTGMPSEYKQTPHVLAFGRCFGAFQPALTGEPSVLVKPMSLTLKAGVDLARAKGKPRVYAPQKHAWFVK